MRTEMSKKVKIWMNIKLEVICSLKGDHHQNLHWSIVTCSCKYLYKFLTELSLTSFSLSHLSNLIFTCSHFALTMHTLLHILSAISLRFPSPHSLLFHPISDSPKLAYLFASFHIFFSPIQSLMYLERMMSLGERQKQQHLCFYRLFPSCCCQDWEINPFECIPLDAS